MGKYTDIQIEAWMEWRGEPGALIAGLVAERWIDPDPEHRLIVHDWHLHADKATKNALMRSKTSFLLPTCTDGVRTLYPLPVPEPVPVPVLTAADAAITPSVMIADYSPAFELSSSTENQDRDSSYSGRSKIIDEFETEFWPIVWLKVGKDAALKAYRSARKRASCDEIKRGAISLGPLIVRQAAAQHRTPVGPGPWLNAGRWSDSPEVYLTGLDRNGKLSPDESKAAQRQRVL